MKYYIDLLSIQTPKPMRSGLEHRTRYGCGDFEVNIFETFQSSTKVQIAYEGLTISSMIRGSKTIHTPDGKSFEFAPGTSLILPEGEMVYADFPTAGQRSPVQCATILIPSETIDKKLEYLNSHYPNQEGGWALDVEYSHFNNNSALVRAFNELLQLATQQAKNYPLTDLLLKSLIVRLVEAQKMHINESKNLGINNQLFLIKKYIKDNLTSSISTQELTEIGNCSKSKLYRMFEEYCNTSPGAYILQERMVRARNLLLHSEANISDVAYSTGFGSVSYFVKQFKSLHRCTPGEFIKKFAI